MSGAAGTNIQAMEGASGLGRQMAKGVALGGNVILWDVHEGATGEVVAAIRRNRARVFMPPGVHAVPPLRALPAGVFDFVADFSGVSSSMEEFKGRGERASRG